MSSALTALNASWQRFAHELVHEASGRGWTYMRIAREAGVSPNTIAQIFQEPNPLARNGLGRVISDETAEKIAERLKEALK